MRELKEITLIEEAELQVTTLHQRADLRTLERRDPGESIEVTQLANRLVRDHAPIPHEDQALKAKLLAQLIDLRHQRARIGGVALVDRDGHRTARPRGEQSIVHLRRIALAVAAVTDLRQRTAIAFEVARTQVIERQGTFREVPSRELLLDRLLALEQPVHRRIQIGLVPIGDAILFRQRRRMPPARGGELGVRRQDPRRDHRTDSHRAQALAARQSATQSRAVAWLHAPPAPPRESASAWSAKAPRPGARLCPASTARIASICSSDRAERLAIVRLRTFLPSRYDSRSR